MEPATVVIPEPVESALQKWDRAVLHRAELDAVLTEWLASGSYDIRDDLEGGVHVVRLVLLRPIDPNFSLIFGDCVHNLRSSLDHMVFALAAAHEGQPLTGDEAIRSGFPVSGQAPLSRRQLDGIEHVDPKAREFIEFVQPHHLDASYQAHALWVLNQLDNIDKHRSVHLTVAGAIGAAIGGALGGGPVSVQQLEFRPGRVSPGQSEVELARYVASNAVDFEVAVGVCLDDSSPVAAGRPVDALLDQLITFVEQMILSPLLHWGGLTVEPR
jgi:hypothetical protein